MDCVRLSVSAYMPTETDTVPCMLLMIIERLFFCFERKINPIERIYRILFT